MKETKKDLIKKYADILYEKSSDTYGKDTTHIPYE